MRERLRFGGLLFVYLVPTDEYLDWVEYRKVILSTFTTEVPLRRPVLNSMLPTIVASHSPSLSAKTELSRGGRGACWICVLGRSGS